MSPFGRGLGASAGALLGVDAALHVHGRVVVDAPPLHRLHVDAKISELVEELPIRQFVCCDFFLLYRSYVLE